MYELWMPYPEINKYEVSTYGNVRVYHGGHRRWEEKSQRTDKDGYKTISVSLDDGTETTRRVHRMVADTFIPNPSNCAVVHHKDNVKDNNHASNLEWTTVSFNTKHAYHIKAIRSPMAKYIKATIDGNLFSYYESCAKCAKDFGAERGRIEACVNTGILYNEIIKLEEVDSLPISAIIGKRLPFVPKALNPYKISTEKGDVYFYNIKNFSECFDVTYGQAQWALNKKKEFNGHVVTKVSKREYVEKVVLNRL